MQNTLSYSKYVFDKYTKIHLMESLQKHHEYAFLLESAPVRTTNMKEFQDVSHFSKDSKNLNRYSVIGFDPNIVFTSFDECYVEYGYNIAKDSIMHEVEEYKTDGTNILERINELIQNAQIDDFPKDLPNMSAGIFGFFGYDMIQLVENVNIHSQEDILNIPNSVLIAPTKMIIFDNVSVTNEIILVQTQNPCLDEFYEYITNLCHKNHNTQNTQKKVGDVNYYMTKDEYIDMVNEGIERIQAGDIYQILLSQRFSVNLHDVSDFSVYRALRQINPSPFLFFMKMKDFSLLGASPEILVKVENGEMCVRPLAGTRLRGKTEEEDSEIAKELLSDPKEIAEHLMLIDLGRHDIGRVCDNCEVPAQMFIEYYSHVMHISSIVKGKLSKNHSNLDALLSGFPAGTVSGAPKIKAMQIIHKLESYKRSFYSGSVGYFASNGDMNMCITLRSAMAKNQTIYFQSGGGIVYDSDPDFEYMESMNKSKAMMLAIEESVKY